MCLDKHACFMQMYVVFKKIFWGICAFISEIGQLKSRQETGEREGMTCNVGSQVESNLWPMRWGHSLCMCDACSTNWATGCPCKYMFTTIAAIQNNEKYCDVYFDRALGALLNLVCCDQGSIARLLATSVSSLCLIDYYSCVAY